MINGKSVSLCMVVYNSSQLLKISVDSVRKYVDEIVIVDQGSDLLESANIVALIKTFTENQYHKTTNKGNGDFDRQFCYAMATKEYVLALDADETVPEETMRFLETKLSEFDFEVVWFFFNNLVKHNEKEIDLKKFLKEDPHPRFWKREIEVNGRKMPPIVWSADAHQFPQIVTENQAFLSVFFNHHRDLRNIITTHLHRAKNINPQAQNLEKSFIRGVLNEFGFDIQKQMVEQFPALREYLRG